MAYAYTNSKGRTYYLNEIYRTLNDGKEHALRYFSTDDRSDTTGIDELPEGYTVTESEKTGLPLLKKAKD